ncbi:MAG TPA: hypothetical protein VMZ30_01120 [Pyrinomonadaceae bacterium]|nr:hypothetical protein [Pyrinomonadaceae bacterium]
MRYKFKLKGLNTPPGTISIRALKDLIDTVIESSERGLRLAVQGESVKRGPIPGWLARSLDFTVTGLRKGSTTVLLEAPELGETAPEQIKQQDLWYSKPTSEDTAISLLSRSVKDAVSENLESSAYDRGVLDGLLSFESFFKSYGDKLIVQAIRRPSESFSLSSSELERVRHLKADTPEPVAFLISGQFDLIQHSSRKFHLLLSNSQVIPGTIDRDILNVENMREFWGRKVTIKGIVHFNPGRKVRLLEAHTIKLAEEGEEIFEKMPVPPKPVALFDSDLQKISVGSALKEIWGKWPGDEPIDELLAALTP